MLSGKKIVVVMPSFNAAATLERTVVEIPRDIVDEIILVDDGSSDATVDVARRLGLKIFLHDGNFGYGRNQKTCYREALHLGADIVVMVHPDYQYSPKLIVPMAGMIAYGEYDVVIGSRILGNGALKGGMPLYKYVANRCLTLFQNILMGQKFSEYHTGFRAFSTDVLRKLPLDSNSDDFVFDNQMLVQAVYFGFRIGEISTPTRYFDEASSINFSRAVRYGLGVVATALSYRLDRMKIKRSRLFQNVTSSELPAYYHPLDMSDKSQNTSSEYAETVE